MTDKPACSGTTRKGEPCKSPPLKGTPFCLAHSPAEVRETVGFIPDNGKGGRKPMPKPDEIGRQVIREHVAVVLRPHFRILGYHLDVTEDGPVLTPLQDGGAKLYGTRQATGEIRVSEHDDLGAQVTAAEKLLDRFFGKPRQAVEHTGPEGGPVRVEGDVDLSRLSPEQLEQLRGLLADAAPEPG